MAGGAKQRWKGAAANEALVRWNSGGGREVILRPCLRLHHRARNTLLSQQAASGGAETRQQHRIPGSTPRMMQRSPEDSMMERSKVTCSRTQRTR